MVKFGVLGEIQWDFNIWWDLVRYGEILWIWWDFVICYEIVWDSMRLGSKCGHWLAIFNLIMHAKHGTSFLWHVLSATTTVGFPLMNSEYICWGRCFQFTHIWQIKWCPMCIVGVSYYKKERNHPCDTWHFQLLSLSERMYWRTSICMRFSPMGIAFGLLSHECWQFSC